MSAIQTCLSVFAVASWANNDASLSQADRAIEGYLEGFSPDDHRFALIGLLSSFRKMNLDSSVANAIRENLNRRIDAAGQMPPSIAASKDSEGEGRDPEASA